MARRGFLDMLKGSSGDDVDTNPSSDSGDQSASDLESVKAQIRGNRKARSRAEAARERATNDAEIDALFEKENWEEVASLYFDARFVMTGYKGFQLNQEQKSRLGLTMAKTMKVLLKIDPAYIAILVFCTNYGGLIAAKEVEFRNVKAMVAQQRAAQQARKDQEHAGTETR